MALAALYLFLVSESTVNPPLLNLTLEREEPWKRLTVHPNQILERPRLERKFYIATYVSANVLLLQYFSKIQCQLKVKVRSSHVVINMLNDSLASLF